MLTYRDEYLPLTYFDKVYLIDLCEPLLEVARARCQQKGWKNVVCLCQDASRFVLPEWESGELDPKESLSVITMSYSLSMVRTIALSGLGADGQIPSFYQLLDRCDQVLDSHSGLMGVVDFYTSRDPGNKERVSRFHHYRADRQAIGSQSKTMSWFAKWFWECWFEMDNVHLHGSRRGESLSILILFDQAHARLPRIQNGMCQDVQRSKQFPRNVLYLYPVLRLSRLFAQT